MHFIRHRLNRNWNWLHVTTFFLFLSREHAFVLTRAFAVVTATTQRDQSRRLLTSVIMSCSLLAIENEQAEIKLLQYTAGFSFPTCRV